MNTLKKRVLSSVLAASATLSMAVPVFAADTSSQPANTTVVTGKYKETEIAVVVPGNTEAIINPYGIGLEVKDGNDKVYPIAGKIATPVMAVRNQSSMNLQVGAKISTTVSAKDVDENSSSLSSGAIFKLVSSDIDPTSTSKQALVKLQMVTAVGITGDDDTVADKIVAAYANEDTWKGEKFQEQVLTPPTSSKPTGETTMDPDKVTLSAAKVSDGEFSSYNDGSIALVRLTGDVSNSKYEWFAEDGFQSTIVFTFTPAAAESGN